MTNDGPCIRPGNEPNTRHGCDTNGSSPFLTIVLPAYNEEQRLPASLAAIVEYFSKQPYDWELIIVDDGSDDSTAAVASQFSDDSESIHLLRRTHMGKAPAVRAGALAATGANLLITDADLSTPVGAVEQLLEIRSKGYDIVIGSREAVNAQRIQEPFYRHLMGRTFNWAVRLIAVRGIRDTQCGFKLLSRDAVTTIFPKLLVSQPRRPISGPRVSAFDVEILFLGQREGFKIAEVPVVWTHATGSKVRPGVDAIRMFVDVLTIRWNAIRGKY
jgi:dolichyl-phosphate beta-glucosyltransferase